MLDEIPEDYQFDVSCSGSVPQAFEAFFEADGFIDAIRNAISIGGDSDTIGAIAGSMESKASVVTLTLFDIRSGVQISIAEGNATATNFGAAFGALGGGAAAGLGGFSRTPAGKASVAAFVDAYNNMVVSLRNYKAQEVQGGLGKGGTLKVAD